MALKTLWLTVANNFIQYAHYIDSRLKRALENIYLRWKEKE